jgi:hypothetical protein
VLHVDVEHKLERPSLNRPGPGCRIRGRRRYRSVGRPATGACLRVLSFGGLAWPASSTPPPAQAWPVELPASRPSPATAHGRPRVLRLLLIADQPNARCPPLPACCRQNRIKGRQASRSTARSPAAAAPM